MIRIPKTVVLYHMVFDKYLIPFYGRLTLSLEKISSYTSKIKKEIVILLEASLFTTISPLSFYQGYIDFTKDFQYCHPEISSSALYTFHHFIMVK